MRKRSDSYIPSDYQDLYSSYCQVGGLVDGIIRKKLKYATSDERETLRHDIFLRMLDKGILEYFDPSKSQFGGQVYMVARTVIVNHLERKGRNPVTGLHGGSLVESHGEAMLPGEWSLEALFGSVDLPDLDRERLVDRIFSWARDLKERNRHKRDRSILPLMVALLDGNTVQECGEQLGVTRATVYNWLKFIREEWK